MAVNGKNILIYVGGALIAGTRSDEVQTDCGMIPISSPDYGEWEHYLAGRKSWAFNQSWLIPNTTNIERLLLTGTTVTIRILARGATKGLTGQAIVKTCKITNTIGNISNGSFSFQGTGPLTKEV